MNICSIFIFPNAGADAVAVPSIVAVAGRGLVGDRYHAGTGSFSRWPGEGRDVTLIETEVLETVLAETGIDLRNGRSRRNLETHGIASADLLNRRFRIGEVVIRGARLCLPCKRLERLTEPGAYAALRRRGGLRGNILTGGYIRAGDAIELL